MGVKLREGLLRYVSADAAAEARLRAASGEDLQPGHADPADRVTVLAVLSQDPNGEVSEAALASLAGMAAEEVCEALRGELDPLVIRKLVAVRGEDGAVLTLAALNPSVDDHTLDWIARNGPAEVAKELKAETKLLEVRPWLEKSLAENPALASAGAGEGAEEEEEESLYKRVQKMKAAEKIKLAYSGGKEARDLLIKDSNKTISSAVLKNPRITDEEISRLASSKNTGDELLREISRNREWLRNYSVKLGLVTNPKTPLNVSLRLIDSIRGKDLEKIAKSKDVSNVLATAARKKVERMGRG